MHYDCIFVRDYKLSYSAKSYVCIVLAGNMSVSLGISTVETEAVIAAATQQRQTKEEAIRNILNAMATASKDNAASMASGGRQRKILWAFYDMNC